MSTHARPDDRALLIDRDQQFFDALVSGDVAALRDLMADDFVIVSITDGAAVTKSELLGAVSSGAVQFPAVRSFPDEAIVRRIGDVGITVGRTEMNVANADGSTFTAHSRYTHVFVFDADAQVRLLSAQGTEIRSVP
jgi:ketosteroid isomerase-like protein